jgi:hypothetical protein
MKWTHEDRDIQYRRIPRKKKKFLKKGGVILYKDTWISIKHGQTWYIRGVEVWKRFYGHKLAPRESFRFDLLNFNKNENTTRWKSLRTN